MSKETNADLIIERHDKVVATIERWLHAAGFAETQRLIIANGDLMHESWLTFWRYRSKVLISYQRRPNMCCTHPHPLFDLYRPIDTSNQMDKTREAIFAYAAEP